LHKYMKLLLKVLSKKSNLLLIAIFLIAIFIRFYNFPNRVGFSSEQARSLIVSSEYLNTPSFLGQDYFIGHDSNGHVLFAGAFFNYLLVPVILITKDVVPITILFAILNIATGFAVYYVAKKIFNEAVGIASAAIFLFSNYMIYHSLFIWIYNPLPLIGILTVYFIYLYSKKQKIRYILTLGFLSGIGITLQYLYAPIAAIVMCLVVWKSKNKLQAILYFILTGILPNLPMLIFDLRHNFYNSSTIIQMFLDALAGKGNAKTDYFVYYHFFPFWPIFAIAGGWMFMKIYNVNKFLGIILISLYIYLNLVSPKINFNHPTSTPGNLYVTDIDEVSKRIALDAKGQFNVVEVLDFDKQAYMLRYFIEYKYGNKPMSVESYPNAKILYVLAPKNYNFAQSGVWEIYSGGPSKVELFYSLNDSYGVYKLTRNKT
jgi:hypothetical protein